MTRQADAAGLLEPQFEVAVAQTGRVLAPCARAVAVEPLDVRLPNRMRFAAVCPGAAGWKYEFVVRAAITARVAVSSVPVPAGRALAADEVVLERRDISAVADSVADLAALLGQASRRSLRAGELLRKSQFAALPLVKRGEAVRIVARRAQVEVSMAGEALEAGALDAVVRVRNAASGNVIRARVVAAGTVEPVDLPGAAQSSD
ncbi:flagellar basal body P-ring formation chaperone FlgA [Janthinobacterium fluminis]|uniref:Flagella basal body P-ring formation protein FlgA n=1 Tax=Janthinobacterium fluminis TaxID=2987524 RepID=A0ABT5JUS1_9BURK|nr:flagellar basal body P-ring formation chaperone FlgA [Janthinobacterium fluminis]MDC8756485.1 flagellar basal body P-ring formation chaperone FlgA [Janthinobacterium fluminis]